MQAEHAKGNEHPYKLHHPQHNGRHVSISIVNIVPSRETQKYIERLSIIGGFEGSHWLYKAICVIYMTALFSTSLLVLHHSVCIWLNIYVTLCQFDGLVCYLFGVKIIDQQFITQISQHISFLNDCYRDAQREDEAADHMHRRRRGKSHLFTQYVTGQTLLKQEFIKIGALFLVAWCSSLIIVFDNPWRRHLDFSDSKSAIKSMDHLIIVSTAFIDFLRYTPSAILILLIRLYFWTFSAELTEFRQRYGIITRFEKFEDIEVQQSLLGIRRMGTGSSPPRVHRNGSIQSIQNEFTSPNLKMVDIDIVDEKQECLVNGNENTHELFEENMTDSSPFIVQLNISHFEFKRELESILFPYRNMCRSLRLFFLCNLILNGLCFVFVVITTIKGFVDHVCDAEDKYYLHYVTEMTVYFIGWVLLMIPLAENHRALRSLNRDVKARVILQSPTAQVLVHQYLDSMEAASPFAIGYIVPTYSQLMLVFYVLTFVVGGQLISFFVYNQNKR